MVKGISRQVIVVKPAEQKLFEEAIFILRDDALGEGVTDEALLREANSVLRVNGPQKPLYGPLWAAGGAFLTGLAWALSVIL